MQCLWYTTRPYCVAKRWVFRANLKLSVLRAESRRQSGSKFHSIGPATEKAWWPNQLWRCHGTINCRWLADLRHWQLETSDVHVQQSIRYWEALFCRRWWTVTPKFMLDTLWNPSMQPEVKQLGQATIKLPDSIDHSGCRVEHPLNLKPVGDGP